MEKKFNLYMSQSDKPVAFDQKTHTELSKKFKNKSYFQSVNKSKSGDKTFWLLDGPPYANGSAHMGHALNKTWKDFNVKFHWWLGHKVDWNPGWDCHGLPLELLVEKQQKFTSQEEKKAACKKLALSSVAKQKSDFHDLAVTADWENPYLTLSKDMRKHTWNTLSKMFSNNNLEYKEYPTHHCPACGSSLAEAELEYQLLDKEHLYFKYQLSEPNTYALVWTTTPWTLPMNQALAFSSKLSYTAWHNAELGETLFVEENCSSFVLDLLQKNNFKQDNNKSFESTKLSGVAPLTSLKTPLLDADFVATGETGFVHVACAHGAEDFQLGQANGLQPLHLLTKHGQYLQNDLVHPNLTSLKTTSASPVVLDLLKQNNLFFSYHQEKAELAVCWRHKAKVYYQSNYQVFLNLDKLKPKVEKMLDSSHLNESAKDKLKNMLLSRPNWCLSRQRYWGTPMNLLVDKTTNKLSEHTPFVLNLFYEGKDNEALEFLNHHPHLKLVTDVVDVWLDSGNVPLALQKLKGTTQVPDLALEGKDQFRGWFQSMLWLQAASSEPDDYNLPYADVLVHGFVLDQNKSKFSKSNKNGLSAKEAVLTYGADTVRVWSAMQEKETDAVFSKDKMKEAKTLYQRLRLTLRFLSSNLGTLTDKEQSTLLQTFQNNEFFDFHLFVLQQTELMQDKFEKHLKEFEFKDGLLTLYSFFDSFLNPLVFDTLKPVLYLKKPNSVEKQMAQVLLYNLFQKLCPLTAVFCPLTAEEFWQTSKLKDKYDTVFHFSKLSLPKYQQPQLNWELAFNLKKLALKLLEPMQKNKDASTLAQTKAIVPMSYETDVLKLNKALKFQYWLGVSDLEFSTKPDLVLTQLNGHEKCPRCWGYFPKQYMETELCNECAVDNQ